jgi:CRP-like cAMP-binding protein
MISRFKQVLGSLAEFNEQQLDKIAGCVKPRSVRKNEIILHQGETCREFYFVNRGGIRTYFITRQGQEKTRYVMLDCSIGTALTSFIRQEPSFEFIDALEDTELLVISHTDFYQLNKEMSQWSRFYQRILEMAYSFQTKKIETRVTMTAKQRYDQLIKENPVLVQRLSNRILASYLDMREETLSRVKSI